MILYPCLKPHNPILVPVTPFLPVALLLAGLSMPDQLARDLFQQLINLNTDSTHGTTAAAEAVAARLKAAGFDGRDVQIAGGNPRKQNVVARIHGSGARKPVLFIGHL